MDIHMQLEASPAAESLSNLKSTPHGTAAVQHIASCRTSGSINMQACRHSRACME